MIMVNWDDDRNVDAFVIPSKVLLNYDLFVIRKKVLIKFLKNATMI